MYRSDFSSQFNNYPKSVPHSSGMRIPKLGRMFTSPSLERLSSFDRVPNKVLIRQKSFFDLSSVNDSMSISSVPITKISHRNPSLNRLRDSSWRHTDPISNYSQSPRTRHRINGHTPINDSFMMPPSHSPTPPRHSECSPLMDRRDLLIGSFNTSSLSSSPKLNHRMPINRSSLTMRHQWHVNSMSNADLLRPRIRERPILAKIGRSIRSRQSIKSPRLSSPINSTNYESTIASDRRESVTEINRYRLIKFREHNVGQTVSERRSSITWDLPGVSQRSKTPESTIVEHQETDHSESYQSTNEENKVCNAEAKENQNKQQLHEEVRNSVKADAVSQDAISTKIVTLEAAQENRASHAVADKVSREVLKAYMPEKSLPEHEHANQNQISEAHEPKMKVVEEKSKVTKKKVKKKVSPKAQEIVQLNSTAVNEQIDAKNDALQKDAKNTNSQFCAKDKDKDKDKVKVKVKEKEKEITNDNDTKPLIVNDTPKRIRFRNYTFDDFNFLTVLGRGSFGKVMLAELKDHGINFAIKCLKKHSVIEDDDVESIMIERKVLAFGSVHPFICNLFCTFQTESYLCFVMEWCCGGDLMFHVQKNGKFPEDRARFYSSEVICAVKFLHKKGIIYRDLKLDNIMLDSQGHVRLVDFGMCQGKIYREEFLPSNFCGTPEYMAPEIIKGVQYNQSVDFWSLGVLLYEMVVGTSPFHGTDEDELLWNVCYEEINYPRYLSENIKSLLILLLNKNEPEKRLGMPKCPAGDICDQPFFASVDWNKVEKNQIKPPFVPKLKSASDSSFFDEEFTKCSAGLTPVQSSIIESIDQGLFKGFSYTNPNMTD